MPLPPELSSMTEAQKELFQQEVQYTLDDMMKNGEKFDFSFAASMTIDQIADIVRKSLGGEGK